MFATARALAAGGSRERMVPLINNVGRTLRWFVEDVWGQLGDEPDRPGAPLFCSERKNTDGSAARRVGSEVVRAGLAEAAAGHLPAWPDKLTPHVLRHFCASQLYFSGMDLIAIQETLEHAWIATTMNYVNPRELHQAGEKPQVTRSASPAAGFILNAAS
jgi:site-specific recombinase XerD